MSRMKLPPNIKKIDHVRLLFDEIELYKVLWGTDDTIFLLETAVKVMKEEYVKPPMGILNCGKGGV